MLTAPSRAPRFRRFDTPKTLLFTERDSTILGALYRYHLATTHQLAYLFPGSEQKTRWRLRELFDAGFVDRLNTKTDPNTPGSDPLVYALTDEGATWLSLNRPDIERQRTRYNENNRRRTLQTIPHTLMVSEIMIRFEVAAYYASDRVAFLDQRTLLARAPEKTRTRRIPTHWSSPGTVGGMHVRIGNNPDQLLALTDRERPEGKNTAYFFLEADRGTESVRPVGTRLMKSTIYKKLLGYYTTHKEKTHATVFGEHVKNFRVLWVIDSTKRDHRGKTRLDNFRDVANEVTGGTMADLFLFTTYDAFLAENPLAHAFVNANGEWRSIVS
jgi:hypothetical protein